MKYDKIGLLNAIRGIVFAVKKERNLKIHLCMAFAAVVLGFYFSISTTEWLILLLVIHMVVIAEIINTAIEKAVDIACRDILEKQLAKDPVIPNAKIAKDAAAGAVLIAALLSLIVGGIIFIPKIIHLF